MKKFYIAVTIKENNLYYSYVIHATNTDNLLSKLKIANIVQASICTTKKQAFETVETWNAVYIANGVHLFYTMNENNEKIIR